MIGARVLAVVAVVVSVGFGVAAAGPISGYAGNVGQYVTVASNPILSGTGIMNCPPPAVPGCTTDSYTGSLDVYYYDATLKALRHARWDGNWTYEWLDGGGAISLSGYSGNVGRGQIVAIEDNMPNVNGPGAGNVRHVFYYDATQGALRWAHSFNLGTWSFDQLDGGSGSISGYTGNVGQYVTAFDYWNIVTQVENLDVFYYDATKGALRHGYWDGSVWTFNWMDGGSNSLSGYTGNVGQFVAGLWDASSNTGLAGQPGAVTQDLMYYDATKGALRYASGFRPNSTWSFETLDGGSGSRSGYTGNVGQYIGMGPLPDALTYQQNVDVGAFYYNATTGGVRRVWGSPPNNFQEFDGGQGSLSGYTGNVGQGSLTLYPGWDGYGLLSYDATAGALRLSLWNGSSWTFEQLDGGGSGSVSGYAGNVGKFSTMINYQGTQQLFYYDASSRALRHAVWNGSSWYFEQFDGNGVVAVEKALVPIINLLL